MLFVLNKQKIISYILAVSMVFVLIGISSGVNTKKSIETSAGLNKKLPIYNVKTDENKIALTINCAWNADDIDNILQTLKKHNIKTTFFVVGEWVDKFPDAVKKINEEGHEIRKSF